MPHWTGLLTKQEAKERRDYYLANQADIKDQITEGILMTQRFDKTATRGDYNMVVHEDVVNFFKNEMSYTVVENKVGQPAGFTLLISISWAI